MIHVHDRGRGEEIPRIAINKKARDLPGTWIEWGRVHEAAGKPRSS